MTRAVGRYQLKEELGRGGMGAVWRAFDASLQRDVALKLMHAVNATTSERERFRVEARAIARLRSAHVVEVYDFDFTEDSTPYIVMELLRGETLSQRLSRVGTMPLFEVTSIVVGLCEGLVASHAAGVLHRDLKPQNIFLVTQGREIRPKILDFGVALVRSELEQDHRLTGKNQLPGTPAYMSPEQIQGARLDERSDLWSLALICYEMLAGSNPFAAPSFASTLKRIVSEPAPPISTLLSEATAELDGFFARALAKRPEERFQSAEEVRSALLQLLERLEERRMVSVLVVDDEPDTCLLIEQSFELERSARRYRFAFAGTGFQALDWMSEHGAPDVVLTDLNMPEMDGMALLEQTLGRYPNTRSVVVTAYGDMTNIRKAMNRGAFDFLIKPIDLDDLSRTLSRAASAARETQAALNAQLENTNLRQLLAPDLSTEVLPRLRNFGGSVLYSERGTVVCAQLVTSGPHDSPERFVERVNTTLDTLAAIMSRFDGTVARYLGDAAIVIFRGARHESRAVMACLDARDTLVTEAPSLRLPVAYGIDSSELIAAMVGAASRKHFDCSVFGPATQRALDLSQSATTNEILISRATWEMVDQESTCVVGDCAPRIANSWEAFAVRRRETRELSARVHDTRPSRTLPFSTPLLSESCDTNGESV